MSLSAGTRFVEQSPPAAGADQAAAIRKWLVVCVIVGAGLRLWQYLANTAIRLDEIAVARNIVDRSLWDLLVSPLAFDQAAPKGFLLVEKAAISLFGSSDYVLRFFPLVSSRPGNQFTKD